MKLSLFALTLNAAVVPQVENVDKRGYANQIASKFIPNTAQQEAQRAKSPFKNNWLLNLNFKLPSKKN